MAKINRTMFNTTIDDEAQKKFKATCKDKGVAMNVVLEAFMRQFCNEEFILGFSKNQQIKVEFAEDEAGAADNVDTE